MLFFFRSPLAILHAIQAEKPDQLPGTARPASPHDIEAPPAETPEQPASQASPLLIPTLPTNPAVQTTATKLISRSTRYTSQRFLLFPNSQSTI